MRVPNLPSIKSAAAVTAVITMLLVLPACSVNVNKGESGEDKKVDIETPVGGIHVSQGADVRDVGLSVYPGARPKPKDDSDEEKSANVNIFSGSFGLKVVAIEFLSDDSPDKVLAYYTNELKKKYGKVLQCAGSDTSADLHFGKSDDDKDSDSSELTCGDGKGSHAQIKIDGKGKDSDVHGGIELKAGTKSNQRIVSVKPGTKGTDFALVYIRTRGKDTI
jgi:hypothetical protein